MKKILFIYFKGTGKTRTLACAVAEIIRSDVKKCVLICCSSNSACDEITTRLLNVLPANAIHRLYAKSVKLNTISDIIRPVCNLNDGKLQMPSLEYLYNFRVVVCTLLTAGFIVQTRTINKNFCSDHFSHIFIDEAGCCTQTLSLVPIAGKYY